MADSIGTRRELANLAKKMQGDINRFAKEHQTDFASEEIFPFEDISLVTYVLDALHELQWEMLNAKGE